MGKTCKNCRWRIKEKFLKYFWGFCEFKEINKGIIVLKPISKCKLWKKEGA